MSRELVALSELIFIELKLSSELQLQINNIAQELLANNQIYEQLFSVKVLKNKNKLFAYEHFFLLRALRNLNSSLKINAYIVSVTNVDIEKINTNYIALTSATSLDAIKAASFERFNTKPKERLFTRKSWAKLLNKHRSTFNVIDKQFLGIQSGTNKSQTIQTSELLIDIPDLTRKTIDDE